MTQLERWKAIEFQALAADLHERSLPMPVRSIATRVRMQEASAMWAKLARFLMGIEESAS